jgi:hypothetical protein
MKVKGYKGFDKDLKCRGFQFEIGGDYETEHVKVCRSGFHFCENPLDVFNYYPPANSRYCEVEGSGDIDRHDNDSKVACTKIHIGSEVKLTGLIQAGVKFILDRVKWDDTPATNTGNWSVATNTGDESVATNTGNWSVATNTGNWSVATNTGNWSVATNTGDESVATNTGFGSVATNTGNGSAATNTGNGSAATNTGNWSAATNTGDYSAAINTGNKSVASNTGECSIATNTGKQSIATNAGYQSVATSTGYQSAASVEGQESIAMAIGYKSNAKGALGCWIVLSEWQLNEKGEWHIVDVQSAKVDGNKIKADTWYMLKDGMFVEADNNQ